MNRLEWRTWEGEAAFSMLEKNEILALRRRIRYSAQPQFLPHRKPRQ